MNQRAATFEQPRAKHARRPFRKLFGGWRAQILALAGFTVVFWPATLSVAQTSRDFVREGFAAKERQQYPFAIQMFGEALKHGQYTPEQRGLVFYGRGASYEAIGLRDLALGDLDAAIALLPAFPNSYIYRALVWSDRREFEKARDDLLQAVRLNPNSALTYDNLGSVYERQGEIDLAIENFGQAIRLDPNRAQAFYNRGHAYLAKLDYQAAMADYDRAVELQSDFADAYSNRGSMYLLLGETEKAITDFNEAIRLNGNDPIFWSNRASAYMTQERYNDALADLDHAQALDPGNPATYLGRGRARLYSNDIPGAIEDLQVALRLRPTNANPAIWLHIARVHQGYPDREELERNAERVDHRQWPASVLAFYLGKLDADRARQDAERGAAADVARRRCEADFYVGEFLSHSDKDADGRRILQAVVDRCRAVDVIFAAAIAELNGKPNPK